MAESLGTIYYDVDANLEPLLGKMRQAESALDDTDKQMRQTEAQTDKLNASMTKLAKAIGGVIAVTAIYSQFKAAVAVTKEFNETISNLSALTGLVGPELDKLSDAARRIGASTSLSASQAAQGMVLIGSQVPALLASTDALAGVTQAAAVLAEAAKTELPAAAAAISGGINQFGLAAQDTDMIINALAAGARNGASSVEQTAAALSVAGTTAKGAGVSFEEFNALVQTLGQGQIFAAEAGTALRNVLLRLDTSADKNLRPSIVGINAALRNMEKEVARGTSTYEKFGIVNKTAADTLLQNIDYFEQTVKAVTDTNEAYEQQARNNDNLATDVKALSSAYEELQLTVGQKLDPTLRGFTQTLTDLLKWLGDSEGGVSKFEQGMKALEIAAVATGAVLAGRVAMSIAATSAEFYKSAIAARAKAAADVEAARAATVLAAEQLIAAQGNERQARGLAHHTAMRRALTVAEQQATAATTALTVAQGGLNSVMTVGARAAAGLRVALAFIGGPAGVALLAATAIYQIATSSRDAATDLTNLQSPLEEVVNKLREMNEIGRDAELRNMAKGAAELDAEYRKLAGSFIAVADTAAGAGVKQAQTTEAGKATVAMLQQLRDAARDAAKGGEQDFQALYVAVRDNEQITEVWRKRLLESLTELDAAGKAAGDASTQYNAVAEAAANMGNEAAGAAADLDTLTDSMRTGSAVAAEYAQKAGRALEDAIDKSAVGKLTRDIRDNAEAWSTATKAELDAAFAVAFATDKYTAQQAALRKTRTGRKSLTEAEREAKKAADDLKKGTEDNIASIDRLEEALHQTTLTARELAQRQAEIALNDYATPEQLEQARALAGILFDITELERKRQGFGKDVEGKIKGNVPVLAGGAFDDQAARYEAEAAAEQERYAAQLERLREAKELEIEVIGGYQALEQQMAQEHADRLMQIEEARVQAMAAQSAAAFGAMASDLEAFAKTFGAENSKMMAIAKASAIAQTIMETYAGAQKAFSALAGIPVVGPALGTAAAAAAIAGGMARVAQIRGVSGRLAGGPVSAGSMYRVNENGAPEVFSAANGQQFMIPNQRGEVISNRNATAGGGGVVINIHNAPQGTVAESSQDQDGQQMIDIWVADFMADGRTASAVQGRFGLSPQGR